ncbi:MAG: hypothetical protein WC806_05725 [Candidatus Gracilibacteria bacterium]|jgi:hypothetical protein
MLEKLTLIKVNGKITLSPEQLSGLNHKKALALKEYCLEKGYLDKISEELKFRILGILNLQNFEEEDIDLTETVDAPERCARISGVDIFVHPQDHFAYLNVPADSLKISQMMSIYNFCLLEGLGFDDNLFKVFDKYFKQFHPKFKSIFKTKSGLEMRIYYDKDKHPDDQPEDKKKQKDIKKGGCIIFQVPPDFTFLVEDAKSILERCFHDGYFGMLDEVIQSVIHERAIADIIVTEVEIKEAEDIEAENIEVENIANVFIYTFSPEKKYILYNGSDINNDIAKTIYAYSLKESLLMEDSLRQRVFANLSEEDITESYNQNVSAHLTNATFGGTKVVKYLPTLKKPSFGRFKP